MPKRGPKREGLRKSHRVQSAPCVLPRFRAVTSVPLVPEACLKTSLTTEVENTQFTLTSSDDWNQVWHYLMVQDSSVQRGVQRMFIQLERQPNPVKEHLLFNFTFYFEPERDAFCIFPVYFLVTSKVFDLISALAGRKHGQMFYSFSRRQNVFSRCEDPREAPDHDPGSSFLTLILGSMLPTLHEMIQRNQLPVLKQAEEEQACGHAIPHVNIGVQIVSHP